MNFRTVLGGWGGGRQSYELFYIADSVFELYMVFFFNIW